MEIIEPSEISMKVNLSRVMRKPTICICENKDADQLHGDREADQRLCFRYTDSTIHPPSHLITNKFSDEFQEFAPKSKKGTKRKAKESSDAMLPIKKGK